MLSFVVPAFNEERALPATLEAIHGAARGLDVDYEIVVADDGSTDATAAVAASAGARVVPVAFRQIARTRNAGAAAARGDRLVFVDADTHIDRRVLAAAVAALDAGAAGGGATPTFEEAAPGWARPMMAFVVTTMRWMRLAAGCFMFARRDAFEAAGGFDERHFAGEEVMLSLALRRQGRFVILRETVVTSARKFIGRSPWQTLWMSLKVLGRGMRGVRRREGNEFWYDERHR